MPLRPKSFELLWYLATRAPRTATKEELLAAVWGSVVVSDDSLVQCIGGIRAALNLMMLRRQFEQSLACRERVIERYRSDPVPRLSAALTEIYRAHPEASLRYEREAIASVPATPACTAISM